MFDGKAFGLEMVGIVKAHVERVISPLNERIAHLERQLVDMPLPKDGLDGKSITVEDVAPMITEEVAKAVAGIRVPEDGRPGKDADPEVIETMVADAVAALPAPEKGKDADPAEMEEMVIKHVECILAGWDKPKDGVDGKDGAPGRDGKDGAPGLNGKDGADAIDAMIDRDGNLVLILSDGRMKNVGLVVGKDGEAGKDGVKGADGTDGVGFDDMNCEVRDDGVYLVWEKGDIIKEARLPVPIYRGVFKDGGPYMIGDSVSFGGSTFIAERATSAKPETPDSGWRLAVKRGRDGKDAKPVKVG